MNGGIGDTLIIYNSVQMLTIVEKFFEHLSCTQAGPGIVIVESGVGWAEILSEEANGK